MLRVILAFSFLFILCSCTNKTAPPTAVFAIDRANNTATPVPKNFLHKTFNLSSDVEFPFTVPPHQLNPHLQGSFRVFPSTDQSQSAVGVLLLNEEQHSELANGNDAGTTFSIDDSPGQSIDLALPPTVRNPVNYYVVFHNPKARKPAKVQADFTISF